MWKLTDDDKLINKALNSSWKYGHKKWHYDDKTDLFVVKDTNYVLGIINPDPDHLEHVSDGTEVDIHEKKVSNEKMYGSWSTSSSNRMRKIDKTETRYQKWLLEGAFESINNLELIKSDWFRIKPIYSNGFGFEFGQCLEVSQCGKMLTIQGRYKVDTI